MGKSVLRRIPTELDDRLKALQDELFKAGIPMTKIAVGKMIAGKIPEININIGIFKEKRRDKRIRIS